MTGPSTQAGFSGVREASEGRYSLGSGGVVAELVLAQGEAKHLAELIGQTVSFKGRQAAARIEGAHGYRDAGLVFDDSDIATSYDAMFQFDRANLTKPIGAQEMALLIAQPGEPTPVGMVRVPWEAWYGSGLFLPSCPRRAFFWGD